MFVGFRVEPKNIKNSKQKKFQASKATYTNESDDRNSDIRTDFQANSPRARVFFHAFFLGKSENGVLYIYLQHHKTFDCGFQR